MAKEGGRKEGGSTVGEVIVLQTKMRCFFVTTPHSKHENLFLFCIFNIFQPLLRFQVFPASLEGWSGGRRRRKFYLEVEKKITCLIFIIKQLKKKIQNFRCLTRKCRLAKSGNQMKMMVIKSTKILKNGLKTQKPEGDY